MEPQIPHQHLNEDRHTSTAKPSICRIIKQMICPCLISREIKTQSPEQELPKQENTKHDLLDAMTVGKEKGLDDFLEGRPSAIQTDDDENRPQRKNDNMALSDSSKVQAYGELPPLSRTAENKWQKYPIYQYAQQQIFILGKDKAQMLATISRINIEPSDTARRKTNKSHLYQKFDLATATSNVDKFWHKRYFLFQKFDEGISLDEQSWSSAVPEAVAEHIANKICCEVVLDGFCGAGSCSIKLASTCSRVIANDRNHNRIRCLRNNAEIYCCDRIEMINESYLSLDSIQPDVILLSPPLLNPFKLTHSVSILDFRPSLDQIIRKSIQLSRNIVMLLPANIDIESLAECISSHSMKTTSNTCSLKIEKIFFMAQLKYVAIYLGTQVQQDLKLNDELRYIYNLIRGTEKKAFTHRKIVKKIREDYGMVGLLNFVFESQKIQTDVPGINKFYDYIREKKLLSQEKIDRIIKQQNQENQKYEQKRIPNRSGQQQVAEEEKFVGEMNQDDQRTISYYSMGSAVNCRLSVDPGSSEQGQKESIHIVIKGPKSDMETPDLIKKTDSFELQDKDGEENQEDQYINLKKSSPIPRRLKRQSPEKK